MRADLYDLDREPVPSMGWAGCEKRVRLLRLTAEAIGRLDELSAAGRTLDSCGEVEAHHSCFTGLQAGFDELKDHIERWANSTGEFLDWLLTPSDGEQYGVAIAMLVDPHDPQRATEWAFEFELDQPDDLRHGTLVTIDIFRMGRVDGRAVEALEVVA